MDPFVLSRNAFQIYCSEYTTTPLISNNNHTEKTNEDYHKAIDTLNQRYKYFLQTLDRLRISFDQTTKHHNINSISNREPDTFTLLSTGSKRSNKKRLYKSSKQRMPKVCITVSCGEHRTQQQPNVRIK
jgi:hypothetical protein